METIAGVVTQCFLGGSFARNSLQAVGCERQFLMEIGPGSCEAVDSERQFFKEIVAGVITQ